jgi:hypothetical protein
MKVMAFVGGANSYLTYAPSVLVLTRWKSNYLAIIGKTRHVETIPTVLVWSTSPSRKLAIGGYTSILA